VDFVTFDRFFIEDALATNKKRQGLFPTLPFALFRSLRPSAFGDPLANGLANGLVVTVRRCPKPAAGMSDRT